MLPEFEYQGSRRRESTPASRKRRLDWSAGDADASREEIKLLEKSLHEAEMKIRLLEASDNGNSSSAKTSRKDLDWKIQELERKNRRLEKDVEEKESQMRKLRRKSTDSSSSRCSGCKLMEEMKKENKRLRTELGKSEQEVKNLTEEINETTLKVMDDYENCIEENRNERSKTLEEKLTEAEGKISRLEKEKETSKTQGLPPSDELLLRRALQDAETSKVALEEELKSQSAQIIENKLLRKTNEKLTVEMESLNQILKEVRTQVEILGKEGEKAKSTIKEYEVNFVKTENEKKTFFKEVNSLKEKLISQTEKSNHTIRENKTLRKTNEKLTAEMESLNKILKEARIQVEILGKEGEMSKSRIRDYEEKTENEKNTFMKEVDSLNEKLSISEEHLKDKENRISAFEEANKQFREENVSQRLQALTKELRGLSTIIKKAEGNSDVKK